MWGERELFVIIGLKMSKKPVRDAGVTTLLLCACDMEREITQLCMLKGVVLGALEWLMGIDDAYAKLENEVAEKKDFAMLILDLDYILFIQCSV